MTESESAHLPQLVCVLRVGSLHIMITSLTRCSGQRVSACLSLYLLGGGGCCPLAFPCCLLTKMSPLLHACPPSTAFNPPSTAHLAPLLYRRGDPVSAAWRQIKARVAMEVRGDMGR